MSKRILIGTFFLGVLTGSAYILFHNYTGTTPEDNNREAVSSHRPEAEIKTGSSGQEEQIGLPELIRIVQRKTDRLFRYNASRLRSVRLPKPDPEQSGPSLFNDLVRELNRRGYQILVMSENGRTVHRIHAMNTNRQLPDAPLSLRVKKGKVNVETARETGTAEAGEQLSVDSNQQISITRTSSTPMPAKNIHDRRSGEEMISEEKKVQYIPAVFSLNQTKSSDRMRVTMPGNTEVPLLTEQGRMLGRITLPHEKNTRTLTRKNGKWVIDLQLHLIPQKQDDTQTNTND